MNIFDYAMQMEKDGEDYYRSVIKQIENTGLKTILTMLADEEVKHYEIIEKMKSSQPELAESTILSDARNVFQQLKDSSETINCDVEQTELYEKARDIEQRSVDFYTEKADQTPEEYQRRLFGQLAEAEKKHYVLLDNIIEFVSRPETWLENAEFHHLDEY